MPELVCAADHPRWLAERRRGVTATDITVITGLSPYDSAYSLFFKKRGDIPDEHVDNDRLRLGRELEPIIIDRWQEARGGAMRMHRDALWRSTTRSWQLATPDRTLWDVPPALQPDSVLELKSWADWDRDAWADAPPACVRAQVLWQMDTLDVPVGHVGVLFLPSGEFRSYIIEHAESPVPEYPHDIPGDLSPGICEVCADIELLRSAGRDFMDRLDLGQPPSPDASSATLAALKARFADPARDKEAEIDGTLYAAWSDAKDVADNFEAKAKGFEAEIREQAGQARILTVAGTKVAVRVTGDQQVKAHTRHVDYIRRTAVRGEGSE